MITIREAAIRQSIEKVKQNSEVWDKHEQFIQSVIEEKFGVYSILVDFLDDSEENLYLAEIDDKEFGKIYLRIDEHETCHFVFDKYRWVEAHNHVHDAIELLQLLDY